MLSLAKKVLDTIDSNFIGIFLYGSQNYSLNTEESDTDAIIIVKESDYSHREVRLASGIIKIYTIKYFLSRLQKGDMECYEILYTKYRFISGKYEKAFDDFVVEFTKVLNLDRVKYALALKLHEHLSNVMWIPLNRDNSKYHRKRVYWSYRVSDQLTRIIDGEPLESTFIYNEQNKEELLKIKSITNYLQLEELGKNLRRMHTQLRELPKYNIEVTENEALCLSSFYNVIIQGEGDISG